jgi:hypothetical protein
MNELNLPCKFKHKSYPGYDLTCFVTGHKSTGPEDPILWCYAFVESNDEGRQIVDMFDGRAALNPFPDYLKSPHIVIAVIPELVSRLPILRLDIRFKGNGRISRSLIERVKEDAYKNLEKMHLTNAQRKQPPPPRSQPAP